jgi:hypothetical protein
MGRDGRGDRFWIFLSGGGKGAVLLHRYLLKRLIPVLLFPAFRSSFALPDLMGALPYAFLPVHCLFPWLCLSRLINGSDYFRVAATAAGITGSLAGTGAVSKFRTQ